ncbi:RNA polymerase sigma factor [bacterium]|nr:RNA polymerase sigma factor [bacterium]
MKDNIQISDEALMALYQAGDEKAFNILYRKYSTMVYGYLKKRIGDNSAVDDIFQATFIKLHSSKLQFNSSFSFAPWLFTIARNTMIDFLKARKVQNKYFQNSDINKFEFESLSDSREETQAIDLAMLPSSQRSAIEMRYFEDLSFEEIAKRLTTSQSNVRKLVSRGVKSLRLVFSERKLGKS